MIPSTSQTNILVDAADSYLSLGYSVIPIRDDKKPIFSWKSNQNHQIDRETLLETIKMHGKIGGLGIVTGSVSQLAVLDFDDPALYQKFREQHPQLCQTYTVKTRRGYHLYFSLSKGTRTRKCRDVDWLWEGCYVVATPSIIHGYQYAVEHIAQPLKLMPLELEQIHAFLEEHKKTKAPGRSQSTRQVLLPEDVLDLYQQDAVFGRNNALFKVSLLARDSGWPESSVVQVLLDTFVHDDKPGEDLDARRREGRRTIASAFTRPSQRPILHGEPSGLPNTIREEMLKRRLSFVIRTIEGLRQKGIRPGERFTEEQARELLTGVVGRHSIRQTLKSFLKKIEKQIYIANDKAISQCYEISTSKSELIQKGRKIYFYKMPSNRELAKMLKVRLTRLSDPLDLNDLSSAKKMRQAVHREFIKRRPGIYPSKWLAKRLGVSIITKQRYDRDIPIHKNPTYRSYPITWKSLGLIAENSESGGVFLEDDTGKRYPPIVGIAQKVLKWGRGVALKVQSFNFYWTENSPALLTSETPPVTSISEVSGNKNHFRYQPTSPPQNPLNRHLPEDLRRHIKRDQRLDNTFDKELLSRRIYTEICKLGQTTFSLSSARRLVDQYDPTAIEYALERVKSKQVINNPAGLLTHIAKERQ